MADDSKKSAAEKRKVLRGLKKTRPKEYSKDLGITRERLDDIPPEPLTPEEIAKGKTPRKPKANFRYYYVKDGTTVSKEDLERIHKLGIAPAYDNVWIATDPEVHLQATGKDDKGRTQYRYHSKHVMQQDHKKYARVIDFMNALPKFERMMDKDIAQGGMAKPFVCAWMIRIMQMLNIRIGNDCYAKENKSYGLTTLLKKHIHQRKNYLAFKFLGKSKQKHTLRLVNPDAIAFVNNLLELPGEHLFQFKSPEGPVRVKSDDLNAYLQKGMGEKFSCKDYRTYAANKFFLYFIKKETKKFPPNTETQKKKNLKNALIKAAEKLGHKPSISKKSYVKYLSDMYMENPDRFVNEKSVDQLMMDLFKLAVEENKVQAGRWRKVHTWKTLWG
jgi:DNA topoisomerase-1